jgi:hypothetical protein
MSVKKNAEAYISGTHGELDNDLGTVSDRLVRFSFPFISREGNLCINLRAYPPRRRIGGKIIKMPGIIIGLERDGGQVETDEDIRSLIGYLEEVLDSRDILRRVAQTRFDRWQVKSGRQRNGAGRMQEDGKESER